MMGQPSKTDLGMFEIRVRGLLGPLLLSALPHVAARPEPRHTLQVVCGANDGDLVEVMRIIVATGLDVLSVRSIPSS